MNVTYISNTTLIFFLPILPSINTSTFLSLSLSVYTFSFQQRLIHIVMNDKVIIIIRKSKGLKLFVFFKSHSKVFKVLYIHLSCC